VWNAWRAVLVLVASAALARAQSITWTGAATGGNVGLWQAAANWNLNRVPNATDDVLIPAGFAQITVNSGVQAVNSLDCRSPLNLVYGTLSVNAASSISGGGTLAGGTLGGGGNITLNGDFMIAQGNLTGTGQLVVAAGRTLTVAPLQTPTLSKPVSVQGLVAWSSGEIAFSAGSIAVQPGGTLWLQGATKAWVASGIGNAITVNAGGNLTKSDSGTFITSGGVAFNTSGTVAVSGGTLQLASPGSIGGSISIAAGCSLVVSGDKTFAAGSSISGSGSFQIASGISTTLGNVSWSNLSLSSGTIDGVGVVSLSGSANQWLGGLLRGSGTLRVNPGSTLAISANTHTLSRTLENAGTLTWSGGLLSIAGGTISNLAGASFTISSPDNCIGSTGLGVGGSLNNSGTITKTGLNTTAFVASGGSIAVNNSGSIVVNQGSLSLSSGGTHTGSFNIAAGAALTFGGSHTTGAASTIVGLGVVSIPASPASSLTVGGTIAFSGTLNISSGSLVANSNLFLGNLNLAGGTISGPGQIAISGTASSWTAGSVSGTGPLVLSAGSAMTISGTSALSVARPVDISGTVNWLGNNLSLFGIRFRVKNGGVLNMSPGGSMYAVNATTASFENNGIVNKNGTNAATFSRSDTASILQFNNYGVVNVNAGSVDAVTGGSTIGTYNLATSTTLSLGGAMTFGTGSTIAGDGDVLLTSGGVITIQGQCTWHNAEIDNANISGGGDLTLAGASSWTGGSMSGAGKTIVPAGATLTLSGGSHSLSRRLENSGSLVWTGGPIAINAVTLSNKPGGVFTLNCTDSILGAASPAVIENLGTINKLGPGTASVVNSASPVTLDNTGTVNVFTGTLDLSSLVAQVQNKTLAAGTWNVGDGATLNMLNAQIRTLNGHVTLSGPGSTFNAINFLSVVNGSFSLRSGRQFKATPNGGELLNLGLIDLDADCTITVVGSYTQNLIGTFRTKWLRSGSQQFFGAIKTQGFGIATLGGMFELELATNSLPPCGSVASPVAASLLYGGFDGEVLPPAESGRLITLSYAPGSVRLNSNTSADYNADGFLDFTDFDAFVAAFEQNLTGADFNDDGFVDFTDFDAFVAVFEAGC